MKHLLLLLLAPTLSAQFFFATTGTDSPTCGPRATPCRTLTTAVNNAPAGSLVIALDASIQTGNTFTKAIVIDGQNFTTIVPIENVAVSVAVSSSATVEFRNATLYGSCPATPSTTLLAHFSGNLILNNVALSGCFALGISCSNPMPNSPVLNIAAHGLTVNGATSIAMGVLGCNAQVTASRFINNFTAISVNSGSISIDSSLLSFNQAALIAGPSSTLRLSSSTVTYNAFGINTVSGAQSITTRNNILLGNSTDGSFTTAVSLK